MTVPDRAAAAWILMVTALVAVAAPARVQAQQDSGAAPDTARITYRTEDMVFVAAGRTAGLAVGDTLELLANDQSVVAHAVVLSVAQRTASARLLGPATRVAVGQLVRFTPHPPPAQTAVGRTAAGYRRGGRAWGSTGGERRGAGGAPRGRYDGPSADARRSAAARTRDGAATSSSTRARTPPVERSPSPLTRPRAAWR